MHRFSTSKISAINDLETIVKTTGLNQKRLEAETEDELASKAGDKDAPRGGPFNPVEEDVASEYAPLLEDIRRMVVLDEVVNILPIDTPMKQYKITSGYGVRVDPFRKRCSGGGWSTGERYPSAH